VHPAAIIARRAIPLPSVRRRLMCGRVCVRGVRGASHSLRDLLDSGGGAVYQWLMIGPAKIYFIIFGLLTIVGGVIGYVKAGSTASIIAGSISGVLLLLAAFLLPQQFAVALIIALLVSIVLAGRFVPAFIKTGKVMPAGM